MTRLSRLTLLAAAAIAASATPALAEGGGAHHGGGYGGGHWSGGFRGGWGGGIYYPVMPYQGVYTVNAPTIAVDQQVQQPYPYQPQGYPAMDPEWERMIERCNRPARRDDGTGGALIGGVVGGVIGNRVADGDRLLGTVAGAAIGAVAGAAIDKAEDKDAERALREECDAYFASHGGPQGAYPGYGYGYPGYVMVPVMLPARSEPCVETTTVTEEWVSVPVRQRAAPRRPAPRTKRVKEKRVYTGS